MFLFILESLGTSELILIGIVALIALGPRQLPQIARKIGKLTAEFRGTASEFKDTWRREVDFEEEKKAFSLDELESEPIARSSDRKPTTVLPEIKPVDASRFDDIDIDAARSDSPKLESLPAEDSTNEKKNWL